MGRHRNGALVRLVEAAYEPASSLSAWMGSLTEVAASLEKESFGAVGRILKLEPREVIGGYAICVEDAKIVEALRAQEAGSQHRQDLVLQGPPGLRRMYGDAPPALRDDPYLATIRQRFTAVGVADMHHITACDGDGHCVTLGLLVKQESAPSESTRAWSMAAVHLATAFRLQRHTRDLLDRLPADAAVMASNGQIVHAQGRAAQTSTRALLREAARRIDAARARTAQSGAEHALDVWRGLIEGTWSIIDRHDHDGRRYIVAVPNELDVKSRTHMTKREAQVAALAAEGYSDKWIGYALGLSRMTVNSHLHKALGKLGVSSRVALAQAFRAQRKPQGDR